MSDVNTPKIKYVLDKYGLDYIPEAHTYLRLNGVANDFTFPDDSLLLFLDEIMHSEEITADQISSYKAELHKEFLENWRKENGLQFNAEELWEIREECILALSL